MSALELKNDIHKYVVETEDLTVLQRVKDLFRELTSESAELTSNDNGHETDIPQWQIEENRKRVKAYYENPDIAVDFKTAMEAIKEKS